MTAEETTSRISAQVQNQLQEHAGKPLPTQDVQSGKTEHSDTLEELMPDIWNGEADIHTLGRGYKHAPHAPVGMFFKYLVHRVNNVNDYDDPGKASKLDENFMSLVRKGDAEAQNKKVTLHHLHHWLSVNPNLLTEAQQHRDSLHRMILRGAGMNVKKIGDEYHVAVTRGLNTPFMADEHPLASFADKPNHEFGSHKHHVWMPLKDLWYTFTTAPEWARGNFGHEDEFLFSNTGTRYEANDNDVKESRFKMMPMEVWEQLRPGRKELYFDDITDADLAPLVESGQININDFGHVEQGSGLDLSSKIGPKTHAALIKQLGPKVDNIHFNAMANIVGSPMVSGHEAKDILIHEFNRIFVDKVNSAPQALRNPNLTAENLTSVVNSVQWTPNFMMAPNIARLAAHPSFNDQVAGALIGKLLEHPERKWMMERALPAIAHSAQSPTPSLHQALIWGLDSNQDWAMPALKACFDGDTRMDEGFDSPSSFAFNNPHNTERYAQAVSHFFTKNPEEAATYAYPWWHSLLSGGRLSDTMVRSLADMRNNGLYPTGLSSTDDFDWVYEDMGRNNPHLTIRQMAIIAKDRRGRQGLAQRDMDTGEAQKAIAENISATTDMDDVAAITDAVNPIHKMDPQAADIFMRKLGGWNPELPHMWSWVYSIASQPTVPLAQVEKWMSEDSKHRLKVIRDSKRSFSIIDSTMNKYQDALVAAYLWRTKDPEETGGHLVVPLPAGA